MSTELQNLKEHVFFHHFPLKSSGDILKFTREPMWTIRHGLMLLWFADLMKVTEEVTIHRPRGL